jgi:hypothetical protein
MKRTIIGKCLVATLCAFSFTGFAGSETSTNEVAKSNDPKTIEELQSRVEKLELFATVINTGYTGDNRNLGETMAFVIKLSRQGNRFADQWIKRKLAEIGTNFTEQMEVANMYASNPDPNVRDKEKALHYAMLAYSQTTNIQATTSQGGQAKSPSDNIQNEMKKHQIKELRSYAIESLAAAHAINGDFTNAIKTEEMAITIFMSDNAAKGSPASMAETLAAPMKQRIELYKKGLPYIDESNNIGKNLWEMSGLPKL